MAVKAVLPRARKATIKKQGASINPQEVAHIAYALYIQRGRLDGYDQQDWFEAQRIISQQRHPRKN